MALDDGSLAKGILISLSISTVGFIAIMASSTCAEKQRLDDYCRKQNFEYAGAPLREGEVDCCREERNEQYSLRHCEWINYNK